MKARKRIRPEEMWAVSGVFGLYTGIFYDARRTKNAHVQDTGKTWKQCKDKGDKRTRVLVTELKPKRRRK